MILAYIVHFFQNWLILPGCTQQIIFLLKIGNMDDSNFQGWLQNEDFPVSYNIEWWSLFTYLEIKLFISTIGSVVEHLLTTYPIWVRPPIIASPNVYTSPYNGNVIHIWWCIYRGSNPDRLRSQEMFLPLNQRYLWMILFLNT